MFPEEVISPVTIYVPFTDNLTGNQTNIRAVLQGCFWNDDSIAVFQKTGQQTVNNVTLYIPYDENVSGRKYITPGEWISLSLDKLKDYWTINPRQLPLMIKGEYDHEFEWASPSASNRIAVQENNLLNANPNIRRARDVNIQNFGTLDMQHIVIRA